jgi:hypothetical protein
LVTALQQPRSTISRSREGESPGALPILEFGSLLSGGRLDPREGLFDPFAQALTGGVPTGRQLPDECRLVLLTGNVILIARFVEKRRCMTQRAVRPRVITESAGHTPRASIGWRKWASITSPLRFSMRTTLRAWPSCGVFAESAVETCALFDRRPGRKSAGLAADATKGLVPPNRDLLTYSFIYTKELRILAKIELSMGSAVLLTLRVRALRGR